MKLTLLNRVREKNPESFCLSGSKTKVNGVNSGLRLIQVL